MKCFDVCAFSHITRESEIFNDVYRPFIGGPAYFLSIALKRLGIDVKVITRLSPKDSYLLDDLRKLDIETTLIPTQSTHSFHTIYGKSLDDRTIAVLEISEPFSTKDLELCECAEIIYIGPLLVNDFDLEFLRKAKERAVIALDVQGFTRRAVENKIKYVKWDWMEDGLKHIDILKTDAKEAKILTGYEDPVKASETLQSLGAKEVVITSQEGVYVRAGNYVYFAPFIVDKVVGRVGRGDTCFASYLYTKLAKIEIEEAIKFIAATTSLKLRYQGPLRETKEEIAKYVQNVYRYIKINLF
jgi:sugar/nucleoside kinase (ribokinase family)